MGKILSWSLAPRQDPRFGINPPYITKKLTNYNYRFYAIVRDSVYIWIVKCYVEDPPVRSFYAVHFHNYRIQKIPNREFGILKEALDYANGYAGFEGQHPLERSAGYVITSIPRPADRPLKNKKQEEKP